MSRYELETEEYRVIVGWDDRLQTFFGQVWALPEGDDSDGPPEFWVGVRWKELPTAQHLIEALGDYETLPEDVVEDLEDDFRNRGPLAPWPRDTAHRLGFASRKNTI
jgi:hypothetical protein